MVKKLVTWYKGFSSFQFGSAAATFSLDVVTARIIQTNFFSAKVATEARYQLRMVPFTYLTCMKNKIKGNK